MDYGISREELQRLLYEWRLHIHSLHKESHAPMGDIRRAYTSGMMRVMGDLESHLYSSNARIEG